MLYNSCGAMAEIRPKIIARIVAYIPSFGFLWYNSMKIGAIIWNCSDADKNQDGGLHCFGFK